MEYRYKVVPFLDEFLAVGISGSEDTKYNIIHLNSIGKEIFEMYISGESEEQMTAALQKEYNATEQQIAELIRRFVSELSQKINVSTPIDTLDTPPAHAGKEYRVNTAQGGIQYDLESDRLFKILFDALKKNVFPNVTERNRTEAEFRNFALFESFFSGYVEDTDFSIYDARNIIESGQHKICADANTHDVFGIFQVVSDRTEMGKTPENCDEMIEIMQARHSIVAAASGDINPGQLKVNNNRTGDYYFVDHSLVRGTLEKGFEYYKALKSPFARAIFILFMILEAHPFRDANGRTARLMMNAELVAAGQSKILIPTVYRYEYLRAIRQLQRADDPSALITVFSRLRKFSASITGSDFDATRGYLERCNAFQKYIDLVREKKE